MGRKHNIGEAYMAAKRRSEVPLDVTGRVLRIGDRVESTPGLSSERETGEVVGVKDTRVEVRYDSTGVIWRSSGKLWRAV
jgi:hypothetical protein